MASTNASPNAPASKWSEAEKLALLLSIINSTSPKLNWKAIAIPVGRTTGSSQKIYAELIKTTAGIQMVGGESEGGIVGPVRTRGGKGGGGAKGGKRGGKMGGGDGDGEGGDEGKGKGKGKGVKRGRGGKGKEKEKEGAEVEVEGDGGDDDEEDEEGEDEGGAGKKVKIEEVEGGEETV